MENFKLYLKGYLQSNGNEVKVLVTLQPEVSNGKLQQVIWPNLSDINSTRSKEEKLGQLTFGTISQVQKAYDKMKGN
jgi:hypothetical protein